MIPVIETNATEVRYVQETLAPHWGDAMVIEDGAQPDSAMSFETITAQLKKLKFDLTDEIERDQAACAQLGIAPRWLYERMPGDVGGQPDITRALAWIVNPARKTGALAVYRPQAVDEARQLDAAAVDA